MIRGTLSRKPQPPRRDRSDEFASVVIAPARARMAAPGDLLAAPKPVASLLAAPMELDPGPSTAAGRRHMARVAALGCMLCRRLGFGFVAAEVHHAREGQGGAQRASDFLTMGLCPDHHRGPRGIHGDRSALKQAKVTELDLLADTICALLEGAAA